MILRSLFLLVLVLSVAAGANVPAGSAARPDPAGAVIVVVDGLGASYVYPEYSARALDGAPIGKAVLFNLTGSGGRVVDLRVPVPETTKSHSVLVTGNSGVNPQLLGPTIFDAARQRGYLCLAVLERGDAMSMLQEMDAVLYLSDNAMRGAEPTPGFRESAPISLRPLFQEWQNRFDEYSAPQGVAGYAGYDAWGLDAAAAVVRNLTGRPFLMLVNVGAVDSAGQNLGAAGYLETVAALDAPLGNLAGACRENNVLLVVTADHGMCFPSPKGKGGHSAEKYAARLESLRVPLVFFGPGVEELNLGGNWSEVDIAPTVLDMLNLSEPENLSWEGKRIPLKKSHDSQALGVPEGTANYQGKRLVANRTLDLTAKTAPPMGGMKKAVGVILILIINLIGAAAIIRIWRKE